MWGYSRRGLERTGEAADRQPTRRGEIGQSYATGQVCVDHFLRQPPLPTRKRSVPAILQSGERPVSLTDMRHERPTDMIEEQVICLIWSIKERQER